MSVAVRITTTRPTVLSALSALALDSKDKVDLLDQIGINMVENTRLRFGDQVSPDGQAWAPSLRAINEGGETLRDTGHLLGSFAHQASGDSVAWGTNVPYAMPLHFGATIQAVNGPYLKFKVPGGAWAQKKEVTLPARPFLGMDSDDEQLVVDIIGAFLESLGNSK